MQVNACPIACPVNRARNSRAWLKPLNHAPYRVPDAIACPTMTGHAINRVVEPNASVPACPPLKGERRAVIKLPRSLLVAVEGRQRFSQSISSH